MHSGRKAYDDSTDPVVRALTRQADVRSPVAASPEIISAMVDRIVDGFEPLRVILFGSWARGTATEWSDVDLLVIFPDVGDKREMAVNIRRALRGMLVCKDIVVSTPDEIRRRGHFFGTVLREALNEGKVLYEREGSSQ